MCDLSVFDNFIAYLADRASRQSGGGYNDFDDYMQIGRIAAWRAEQTWQGRGSFPCYARMTIRHEIANAAIDSRFPVSAPQKVKRQAAIAGIMMAEGWDEALITETLGLEREQLICIRRMNAPVCREEMQ